MTEVSANLRNIFFPKYPRFWKLKLDFFPVKKSFSQIFQNSQHFFRLNFISKKKIKKSENIFGSSSSSSFIIIHHSFIHSFRLTLQVYSVVPTCTPLTCTTTSAASGHDDEWWMMNDEWWWMMNEEKKFL